MTQAKRGSRCLWSLLLHPVLLPSRRAQLPVGTDIMISFFSTKLLSPRVLVIIGASVTPFVSATAHIGHVGEVAGHGHLIGIGLVTASAVLAGWLETREDGGNSTDQDDADEAEAGDKVNA